jgi:hypothetical protein
MREEAIPFKRFRTMTFQAGAAATSADFYIKSEPAAADFRTPADPEAGWATRNPERALLFLFVSPRDCGAVEELMAL